MKRLVVALVAITGLVVAILTATPALTHHATASTDCHTLANPCPPDLAPTNLAAEYDFLDQLRLLPPTGSPTVAALDAETTAWIQDGQGGMQEQAILATIPAGGNFSSDTLVWMVKYTGLCLTSAGTLNQLPDGTPACSNSTWTSVVDATTGVYIVGFTDG